MSTVTRPNGRVDIVKNLGWLLKHGREVKQFIVIPTPVEGGGAILRADLYDGSTYATLFCDRKVLWNFLHRPNWYGLPCVWFDATITIDA